MRFYINFSPLFLHKKCRNVSIPYSKSKVFRSSIPDDKVFWSVEWPEYAPNEHDDSFLVGKVWADGRSPKDSKWNELDGNVNRSSHICKYELNEKGYPLNPMGRTGITGRGLLGRWGPNHAADPLVTRIHEGHLQFVGIQRHDNGEWAIPGGMVDAGEQLSQTLKREFHEEALVDVDPEALSSFWNTGKELYRGYVDDPRNTDNAWMETVCVNYHDNTGLLHNIELKAGDDAKNVKWINVHDEIPLYASHKDFIDKLKEVHSVA